ncbi:pseudouridylate synthase 7 homolog isoform X2 [Eriocheir sinensis]|uniref:pseudouridylate synthase 7 homolog isoform X2 n=1 Tax=Eriocheir sinensis TaxID=95602 RepID=UPI0021C87E86|nr:pseudouridylate synthase 7 homolog isoform X2 [Eriocheir sinensis]
MEEEGSVDCYSGGEEVVENGKGQKAEEQQDGDDVVDLECDNRDVEFTEEIINLDDKDSKDAKKEGTDKDDKDDDKSKKKKKLPSMEEDIGITTFAGEHTGFFGIIKQRYSDFQVNEVDSQGEIIAVTNQIIPDDPEEIPDMPEKVPEELDIVKLRELDRLLGKLKPKKEAEAKEEEEEEEEEEADKEETDKEEADKEEADKEETNAKEEVKQENEEDEEEQEENEAEENATKEDDDSKKIKKEDAEKKVDGEKKEDQEQEETKEKKKGSEVEHLPSLTEVWINVDLATPEDVAMVHQAIKHKYRGVDTLYGETPDGGKYVVVRRRKGGLQKERTPWPKNQMYTTFVLFKENVETVEAINQIAWKARVKPSCFAYAGTKDKRAKTSQLVSVKEVSPQRLWLATKNLRSVHIGNFHFTDKPQRINLQYGNHYRIVLREVDGTDDEVLEAVESLKTKGFINFYGTQPFGNNSVFLRGVGCELLKGNWQQAVNKILAPRDSDVPDLHRCHTTWKETGDAEAALKMLCKGWEATVESQLLTGLVQQTGNDLVEALNRIPRTTRSLYLHAYQSWIWNTIASRRVKKYGLKVLPGDIVRRKGSDIEEMEEDHTETEGEEGKSGDEGEVKTEMESNGQNMSGFHFLTEEEAETTDITDVVLPLPGYNVEYPNNEIKEWYAELLEADGLSFNALKHEINICRAYAARGVYRRMVVVPTAVTGRVCCYRDATKPLLQSDMDKLWSVKVEDNILKEGPNKAAIVEMTLPTSSYISVALRELLKRDTSWQAAQNMPSNVIDRSRDLSRGGRGRGGPWRGGDRGSWKPAPWANTWRDDRSSGWQQGRGGRGNFNPWADQGSFRGRDYGWNRDRMGYGAHVTSPGAWGRGDKRPWRGGDNWGNKRGRY